MKTYTNLFDLAKDYSTTITKVFKEERFVDLIEELKKEKIYNNHIVKSYSDDSTILTVNVLVPGYDKSELKVTKENKTYTISGRCETLKQQINTSFNSETDYELKSTELKNGLLIFVFKLITKEQESINIEIK